VQCCAGVIRASAAGYRAAPRAFRPTFFVHDLPAESEHRQRRQPEPIAALPSLLGRVQVALFSPGLPAHVLCDLARPPCALPLHSLGEFPQVHPQFGLDAVLGGELGGQDDRFLAGRVGLALRGRPGSALQLWLGQSEFEVIGLALRGVAPGRQRDVGQQWPCRSRSLAAGSR
jgi:hypothetical protein